MQNDSNTSSAAGSLSLAFGEPTRIPARWKDEVSGSYKDPQRWEANAIPATDDIVVFEQSGVNVNVDFTSAAQSHSVDVLAGNFEWLLGGHSYALADTLFASRRRRSGRRAIIDQRIRRGWSRGRRPDQRRTSELRNRRIEAE